MSELLCAICQPAHGFEAKIARCFAFVGPYLPLDAHFAIGNFIRDALAGGPIAVKGDGTPYRSYLYARRPGDLAVDDSFARRRQSALQRRSSNQATRSRKSPPQSPGPGNVAGHHRAKARAGPAPQRYVPDTGRAAGELQLDQWTQLDDAIRATARWHRRLAATG